MAKGITAPPFVPRKATRFKQDRQSLREMSIPSGLLRQRLIVNSAGEQKTLSLARRSKTATMLGNASDQSQETVIQKYRLLMEPALLERRSRQSGVRQMQIQQLPPVHLLPVIVSSTSIRCPAFPQIRLAEEQTGCL